MVDTLSSLKIVNPAFGSHFLLGIYLTFNDSYEAEIYFKII